MAKYVFVTGGVTSSLGKGITAASVGRLLKAAASGLASSSSTRTSTSTRARCRPYQHGEVFVTDDGAETDLDLGHYERFIDENLTQGSNVTTGRIYSGGHRQGAPRRLPGRHGPGHPAHHQRDQGAHRARRARRRPDVVIVEVGGTVGDIECLPFLEAIRQMRKDVGRGNVLYVHVTLLPALAATGELKTKPTQHSVKELRGIGIQPDVIVLRSDTDVPGRDPGQDRAVLATWTSRRSSRRRPRRRSTRCRSCSRRRLGRLLVASWAWRSRRRSRTSPAGARWSSASRRPSRRSRSRSSASTSSCPTPTCRSPRRCATRLGERRRREAPLGRLRAARPRRTSTSGSRARPASSCPGGFGHRGIEGKVLAARYAREHRLPVPGPVPGPAVRGHRVRARRPRHRGRQLDRVRPVHREPGHRLHARPARPRGQGRHDAPGPVPGALRAGSQGRRGLRRRGHLRAPPPPVRVQQPLPRRPRGGRDAPVRASRRTAGWWRSSSCATTPGSWPASSTRSSSRRPGAPAPAVPRLRRHGPRIARRRRAAADRRRPGPGRRRAVAAPADRHRGGRLPRR